MLASAWQQGERVDVLGSLQPHAFPLLPATVRLQTQTGLRSGHWFSLGWSCNFFSKCFCSDACPGKVRCPRPSLCQAPLQAGEQPLLRGPGLTACVLCRLQSGVNQNQTCLLAPILSTGHPPWVCCLTSRAQRGGWIQDPRSWLGWDKA